MIMILDEKKKFSPGLSTKVVVQAHRSKEQRKREGEKRRTTRGREGKKV